MKDSRNSRQWTAVRALFCTALLGMNSAIAAPSCQEQADKVAREFEAERKISTMDSTAKCRAMYQVISDLTDPATACATDRPFMDGTYEPLAKAIGDEAPHAWPGK